MFEKLSTVEERYEDISTRLSDPAVISDNEKYRTLMKEYKNLTPIVEKYREYKKARDAHEEAALPCPRSGPVAVPAARRQRCLPIR